MSVDISDEGTPCPECEKPMKLNKQYQELNGKSIPEFYLSCKDCGEYHD